MKWSAHNIELADGTQTMPGTPLLVESPLYRSVMRTLRLTMPPATTADGRRPRVADLGCLEGGWSVALAREGYDVVGIEGRKTNLAKCLAVNDSLRLPNLRFVHDDVRNVAAYGPFDGVLCAGLLYHLDQPVKYLRTLAELTGRVLILDTHFSLPTPSPCREFQLSELTEHEEVEGRWFHEWDQSLSEAQIESHIWASIGNPESFWIEKRHLLSTLIRVGFPTVFEQADQLDDPVGNHYDEHYWRSLFVAIKPA